MHDTMNGRVAVVTGGTAGVGRATVEAFARAGWDIGIIARDQGRLDRTADAVRAAGRRVCTVSADVADAAAVDAAATQIEQALGPIEVWVNNAMATVFAPVAKLTPGGRAARHPGDLSRPGARHDGRAAADARPQPRHDRQCRVGAELPRDPAAIGLLRGEIRGARFHRLAAVGNASMTG